MNIDTFNELEKRQRNEFEFLFIQIAMKSLTNDLNKIVEESMNTPINQTKQKLRKCIEGGAKSILEQLDNMA